MRVYLDFNLTLFRILMLQCKKSVMLQNEVEIEVEIVPGCCYQNEV